MPIYSYKCSHCGFAKDVLQKMSDAPLEQCPSCGQPHFEKQVTAAAFRLKGTGWYVTDFRNHDHGGAGASDSSKPSETASPAAAPAAPAPSAASKPATASKSGAESATSSQ